MKALKAGLSVRARLTLWNVAVLALVLIVLGGSLRYLLRVSLLAGVDRELLDRSQHFTVQYRNFQRGRIQPPEDRVLFRKNRDDSYMPRLFNKAGAAVPPFESRIVPWDRQTLVAAAADGRGNFSTRTVDGELFRICTLPIKDSRGRIGVILQSPYRLTDIEMGLDGLDATLLTLFPIAVFIAGVGGAFLTGRALLPVRRITQATDRIEAQNLSGRLPVTGRDEFSDLATRFNRMLERLETAFERQRRFTADASHELRTPLSIIKANASLALDDDEHDAARCRKTLRAIDSAADRMGHVVQDLLFLARSDADPLPLTVTREALIPVENLLQRVRETLPGSDETGAPRIVQEVAALTPPVRGDIHALTRALGNLLENAVRHTPPDGAITLSAEPDPNPDPDSRSVIITVADTGEGIAPEHLPRLFERFYRADEGRSRPRGGTGLGLAIVKTIITAHGGDIRIESVPGQGTTVTVTLPAAG